MGKEGGGEVKIHWFIPTHKSHLDSKLIMWSMWLININDRLFWPQQGTQHWTTLAQVGLIIFPKIQWYLVGIQYMCDNKNSWKVFYLLKCCLLTSMKHGENNDKEKHNLNWKITIFGKCYSNNQSFFLKSKRWCTEYFSKITFPLSYKIPTDNPVSFTPLKTSSLSFPDHTCTLTFTELHKNEKVKCITDKG